MTTVFYWNKKLYADTMASYNNRPVGKFMKLHDTGAFIVGISGVTSGLTNFIDVFYEAAMNNGDKSINLGKEIPKVKRYYSEKAELNPSCAIVLSHNKVYAFKQTISDPWYSFRKMVRWELENSEAADSETLVAIGSGQKYVMEYLKAVGEEKFDPYEAMNYAAFRDPGTGFDIVERGLNDDPFIAPRPLIDGAVIRRDICERKLSRIRQFDSSTSNYSPTWYELYYARNET